MRVLDDQKVLTLCEEAASLSPLDRAVRTLAAVEGLSFDAAADRPVDARDRALIAARCAAFGRHASLFVACPACGDRLETTLDLSELLRDAPDAPAPALEWRGRRYGLRAPSSRDIAAAARSGDGAMLVRRCVEGLAEDVEAPEAESVEASLEECFPLLRVDLGFDCPACAARFSSRFDASSYLWTDIERHAEALIGDVHRLARAYGWSESEILAMSRRRRAAYLERLAS